MFFDKVKAASSSQSTLLCVGLDPHLDKIPSHLRKGDLTSNEIIFAFCKQIVDATADLVCAFKPQIAYFSAYGAHQALVDIINYVHKTFPKIPVILDAKRGDIGATAEMYARECFDYFGGDAVTANAFMGGDTLVPFTDRANKGVFVLCRTSNPGSGEIQSLRVNDSSIFEIVAKKAAADWNKKKNIGLVVGATYPNELALVRRTVGDMWILVPGIGMQGGDIAATIQNGKNKNGDGLILNSSRAILYASSNENFASEARRVAIETRDAINRARF